MVQPPRPLEATQTDIPSVSVSEVTKQSPTKTAVPHQTPPPPVSPVYDYEKCTIVLVMQIRPSSQEGGPRSVLLSVQNGTENKEDFPLYRLLPSVEDLGGPLPPALAALLEALQQDLPARKERHDQRTAKKVVPVTPLKPPPAKKGTQQKLSSTASTPLPVPTTTNPVPKEGLVLGGVFDGL